MSNSDYLKEIVFLYQNNKKRKYSFLGTIISQLILIYDDVSIINPLLTGNSQLFESNISRHGFNETTIFLRQLEDFFLKYELKNIYSKSDLMENIQKSVIDMFVIRNKEMPFTQEEKARFEELLYTQKSSSFFIRAYIYLFTSNKETAWQYYQDKMKKPEPIVEEIIEETIPYLSDTEYANYGITKEEILAMSKEQVLALNQKIIIDSSSATSVSGGRVESLSDTKVKKLVLTSGNVIIDALLWIGFISTQLLVLFLVGIEIYKG